MKNNAKSEWQYQGAFVIQFRPETNIAAGNFAGRVEHIASYEAAHFRSLDELLAFIERLLKEAQASCLEKELCPPSE